MANYPLYKQAYGPYGSGATVPVQPAAPVFGQPTSTSSTISLNWTGPTGTYTLQRAPVTNNVVGSFATVYTGTTPNYQDGALTFNTTYAYRVKVTVNGVDSAYSSVLQATTATGSGTPAYDSTLLIPAGASKAANYGVLVSGAPGAKVRFNKLAQTGSLPVHLDLLTGSTTVAGLDFEGNYIGTRFEYTAPDGTVYGGASNVFQSSPSSLTLAQ